MYLLFLKMADEESPIVVADSLASVPGERFDYVLMDFISSQHQRQRR